MVRRHTANSCSELMVPGGMNKYSDISVFVVIVTEKEKKIIVSVLTIPICFNKLQFSASADF